MVALSNRTDNAPLYPDNRGGLFHESANGPVLLNSLKADEGAGMIDNVWFRDLLLLKTMKAWQEIG